MQKQALQLEVQNGPRLDINQSISCILRHEANQYEGTVVRRVRVTSSKNEVFADFDSCYTAKAATNMNIITTFWLPRQVKYQL